MVVAPVFTRDRPWSRRIALLLGVLIIAAGGALIWYRADYKVWPWSSTYPSVVQACGRNFEPVGGPETHEQIADQGYHLVRHGDVQGWFSDAQV